MTNPITEPTQSIRERMRNACVRAEPGIDNMIDAILAELMEPSDAMVTAAYQTDKFGAPPILAEHVFAAMIKHVRDSGK